MPAGISTSAYTAKQCFLPKRATAVFFVHMLIANVLLSNTRTGVINKMEFDYTVETNKSFNEAVAVVENETAKADFKVLYVHDVKATIGAKGFKIDPFKIIEICNAKSAYTALKADVKIGLCLPCKINVYINDGKTYISGMRPIILPQFFPEADLGNLPDEVDKVIRNIIDKAR
jgi:uncharacterized protein (DUF302 family)